jgi:hypothetical protein
MASTRSEFALLLAAPDPVEADLAKDLLSSAGIPCMLHGPDRDFGELGAAAHSVLIRPDLLVPKSALARARALLRETWDGASLTDEMALGAPRIDEEPNRSRASYLPWVVFVALLAIAFLFTYARFFRPRPL